MSNPIIVSKLIIENRTSISDAEALRFCMDVVEKGKVSGRGDKAQYCYLTVYRSKGRNIYVSAFKNKLSDRFLIHYNGEIE